MHICSVQRLQKVFYDIKKKKLEKSKTKTIMVSEKVRDPRLRLCNHISARPIQLVPLQVTVPDQFCIRKQNPPHATKNEYTCFNRSRKTE